MRVGMIATLLLGSCAAPPGIPVEERWYRLAGPLDSWVLHLNPDGTFRTFFMTPFTAEEGLAGTWRQSGAGEATLRCDRWSHMIVSGPLRIRFGRPWEEQRTRVRKGLEAFLAAHPAPAFSKVEIEDAATWEEDHASARVTVLPLASLEEQVSRVEVERLLPLLDSYAEGDDPREVHVTFGTHRGLEYLEWRDWGGYTDPVSPAEIRIRIEAASPGETLPGVWVRSSSVEAGGGATRGEGLRYFQVPQQEK